MKTKSATRSVHVAISQFPVTGNFRANGQYIRKLLWQAKQQGADLLQTCEAALSGYGGEDWNNWAAHDWRDLKDETEAILHAARQHRLWVVLGSTHFINGQERPTNCLYLVSNKGEIVDRYDKSFCTGRDLQLYTPGNRQVTWELKGFKFGMMICYDICFPHLYRAYEEDGVEIMIHSFYNAAFKGRNCLDEIGPAWVQTRAADHEMWVFASNSSRRHSSWPSMIAGTDGVIAARMPRHRTGVVTYEITGLDPVKGWLHMGKFRDLYRKGILHNGRPSRSNRAINRKSLPTGPSLKSSV